MIVGFRNFVVAENVHKIATLVFNHYNYNTCFSFISNQDMNEA